MQELFTDQYPFIVPFALIWCIIGIWVMFFMIAKLGMPKLWIIPLGIIGWPFSIAGYYRRKHRNKHPKMVTHKGNLVKAKRNPARTRRAK